jgi:hypothetical protein
VQLDGVTITRVGTDELEGMPERYPGVFYIVSNLVARSCSRPDFLVPSDIVHNSEGRIIGCKAFTIGSI